jgi:hypothetical protein
MFLSSVLIQCKICPSFDSSLNSVGTYQSMTYIYSTVVEPHLLKYLTYPIEQNQRFFQELLDFKSLNLADATDIKKEN